MHELAIVVTGEPIAALKARRGGFAALIRGALGADARRAAFVELDARDGSLPALAGYRGVIVTGSAASVTERAPWILATERRLADAVQAGTPVLGICFGHQLLGQALGGEVARNPRGREIGTVPVELLRDDPLLDAAQQPFLANMTHMDSIVTLPPGGRVLGRTALDPNAAVRFSETAWGVQFHPEIDREAMADYVDGRREAIEAEGLSAAAIRGALGEGAAGRAVLGRFLAFALGSLAETGNRV